jgi:hypothetical protein
MDVDLFREIYAFARQHYDIDKASYHVSAQIERAPQLVDVTDWPALLNQFDAREILHVTFGSVLTAKDASGKYLFRDRIYSALRSNSEAYAANLEKHFSKHLEPFANHTTKNEKIQP